MKSTFIAAVLMFSTQLAYAQEEEKSGSDCPARFATCEFEADLNVEKEGSKGTIYLVEKGCKAMMTIGMMQTDDLVYNDFGRPESQYRTFGVYRAGDDLCPAADMQDIYPNYDVNTNAFSEYRYDPIGFGNYWNKNIALDKEKLIGPDSIIGSSLALFENNDPNGFVEKCCVITEVYDDVGPEVSILAFR